MSSTAPANTSAPAASKSPETHGNPGAVAATFARTAGAGDASGFMTTIVHAPLVMVVTIV
jgi:hypothetical protein